MRCAMCGYEFEQSQLTCHGACPLGAHCMVVCCPRCGYSTVDSSRSRLSRRLASLFGKANRRSAQLQEIGTAPACAEATVCLLELKPGEGGFISEARGDANGWEYLSRYGLLPGTPVRLTQKRPVPIVQIGQTELAIDHTVAAQIFVDVRGEV